MTPTQETAYRFLIEQPAQFGQMMGYTLLTQLHNEWIRDMLLGRGDRTLQAHRGSYKTTAVGVALTVQLMMRGHENVMFIRKTDDDVKEVIAQVAKNLRHPVTQSIFKALTGRELTVSATATAITTGAYRGVSGAAQLLGIGTQSSITGKHADRIFSDDIVNLQDRKSRAERERVKNFYYELRNVCNRGGRIYNTGTPWHKDDALSAVDDDGNNLVMPEAVRYDCYSTGLMSPEEIEEKRQSMPPSLFAANYELKHIASENALFSAAPRYATDAMAAEVLNRPGARADELLRDGVAHIDAAYDGEDYTALTCGKRRGGTLYMYGRMWHSHVDVVLDAALAECRRLLCEPVFCEKNADKAFLAKEIREKGFRAGVYSESENKYIKISTHLRKWWRNIVWLPGTDKAYIDQIMDYTEDAENDDAPDSAACMCRNLGAKRG